MLASTIKTKEEGSVLKPVTLKSLLLHSKEIKGLNTKILYSLFIFRGKVPEAKGEDSKSNRFISLKNIFTINSL